MEYPKYIPIEGTTFVRDMGTGAIINTDIQEHHNYKIQKKIREREEREKNEMKNKINTIENDIREIKEIILSMVKREK